MKPPSNGQYMTVEDIRGAGAGSESPAPVNCGAPPARWATGRPMPPGAGAPGGRRTGAVRAAAARRDELVGRSHRDRCSPLRREDSARRSSSRSLLSTRLRDRLPYLYTPSEEGTETCARAPGWAPRPRASNRNRAVAARSISGKRNNFETSGKDCKLQHVLLGSRRCTAIS